MKPATKAMKDAIAALGVPRREITAITDLGVTTATVWEPAHRALVVENAAQLIGPARGVVIWRSTCGCVGTIRVTTDPRQAGRVTTITNPASDTHDCPN